MKNKGELLAAAKAIGVSQGRLYKWKKLPEYPITESLEAQLEFVTCKRQGRAVSTTPKPAPKSKRKAQPAEPETLTDWATDDKKWSAKLKKQKYEAERLKTIQEARSILLDSVSEILASVQRQLAAEFAANPIQARRVNAIYAKALKELGSIQQT